MRAGSRPPISTSSRDLPFGAMRSAIVMVLTALGIAAAAFIGGRESVGSRAPLRGSYLQGREDAFAGFDGGWALNTPYAVTLTRGPSGITYKFARRWALEAGFDYRAGGREACSRRAP